MLSPRIFSRRTLIAKSIIWDHNQVFLVLVIRASASGGQMEEKTPYLEAHSDILLKQLNFIRDEDS